MITVEQEDMRTARYRLLIPELATAEAGMSGVLQYSVWSLPAFFALLLALVLLLWMTAGHRSREVLLMRAIVAVVALWATARFARTLFTGLEASC